MVTQGGWSARDTLRNAQDKEGLSPLWETSKKGQGGRDKSRRQPGGRHGALWWPISSSLTNLSPPHRLGLRGWFAARQESPSEASESRYQGQSPCAAKRPPWSCPSAHSAVRGGSRARRWGSWRGHREVQLFPFSMIFKWKFQS